MNAAERLFGERGYDSTSIDDISQLADVAVRTIYTHFPSKAAIMLAAFDEWLELVVTAVLQRPVDEAVSVSVRHVLYSLEDAGWPAHPENADTPVHPMVAHLHAGSPDIAGHVLQRWMQEIDRIAHDTMRLGNFERGSLEPQARAVAVFAAWISALSAANGRVGGREMPPNATGHGIGLSVLELLTSGKV